MLNAEIAMGLSIRRLLRQTMTQRLEADPRWTYVSWRVKPLPRMVGNKARLILSGAADARAGLPEEFKQVPVSGCRRV